MTSEFLVTMRVEVTHLQYWRPSQEQRREFTVEMQDRTQMKSPFPRPTVEWTSDATAVVRVIVSAESKTDAEESTKRLLVSHGTACNFAPEHALAFATIDIEPFSWASA